MRYLIECFNKVQIQVMWESLEGIRTSGMILSFVQDENPRNKE